MRYFVYANQDHFNLIDRLNPLHIRENGNLCVYSDYSACYLSWFNYLKFLYPQGYIEFAHFFRVVLGFTANEAQSFYKFCYSRHDCDSVFILDWSTLEDRDFLFLQRLTMSVQLYYGTMFRLDKFKEAFNLFKNHGSKNS